MHNRLHVHVHSTLQVCVRLVEQTQPAAALAESYLQVCTYRGQQLRGQTRPDNQSIVNH
jgi:hypothetical protein